MNVGELIEELKARDLDMPVYLRVYIEMLGEDSSVQLNPDMIRTEPAGPANCEYLALG